MPRLRWLARPSAPAIPNEPSARSGRRSLTTSCSWEWWDWYSCYLPVPSFGCSRPIRRSCRMVSIVCGLFPTAFSFTLMAWCWGNHSTAPVTRGRRRSSTCSCFGCGNYRWLTYWQLLLEWDHAESSSQLRFLFQCWRSSADWFSGGAVGRRGLCSFLREPLLTVCYLDQFIAALCRRNRLPAGRRLPLVLPLQREDSLPLAASPFSLPPNY